jgi:hypothetical protein
LGNTPDLDRPRAFFLSAIGAASISASIYPDRKLFPSAKIRLRIPASSFTNSETTKRKDAKLVQVMPVQVAEFKSDPSANDETILRKQAEYEAQYWHPIHSGSRLTKLPNDQMALLWSLARAKEGLAGNEQVYLSLRQEG